MESQGPVLSEQIQIVGCFVLCAHWINIFTEFPLREQAPGYFLSSGSRITKNIIAIIDNTIKVVNLTVQSLLNQGYPEYKLVW